MSCPFERAFNHPFIVCLGWNDVAPHFKCELCEDLTPFNESLIGPHCSSQGHVERVTALKNLQDNPLAYECVMMQSRIENLGSKMWQATVREQLFWSLMKQAAGGDSSLYMNLAMAKLCSLETAERISLMQLAVWKAMCVSTFADHDGAIDDNNRQDCYAWMEWTRRGWKQVKSEKRSCNEIGIVVAAVAPFLVTAPTPSGSENGAISP